jgi:transcriptional regulator with XRE-family HTH domain
MVATERQLEPPDDAETIGPLLTRLRWARGWSQLQVAERLCAASGVPTVTRHELSRWEREERLPGPFWLGWLATVLEASPERLQAAVAAARARRGSSGDTHHRLWQPPSPTELTASLTSGEARSLRELALAWLAGRPGPPPPVITVFRPDSDPEPLDTLAARLQDLRRTDDYVGGLDLAERADQELAAAITALSTVSGLDRRQRAMHLVAEFAQLAGWVHTDAGHALAARRALMVGLRAACAVDDRPLAAHILGTLSHHLLQAGDPQEALLLARTAYQGVRGEASALTQALLLHRVALAAAHAGQLRSGHAALAAAEREASRTDPSREPSWLYWLDPAELSAMSGRCLAALGRSLRASEVLSAPRGVTGPRTAAIYAAWWARSLLGIGEMEQACKVALRGLRAAIAAGSARAAAELWRLHPRLLHHRDLTMVRGYGHQVAALTPLLPESGWPRPEQFDPPGGVSADDEAGPDSVPV